jgi:hypothetical protein
MVGAAHFCLRRVRSLVGEGMTFSFENSVGITTLSMAIEYSCSFSGARAGFPTPAISKSLHRNMSFSGVNHERGTFVNY